MVYADTRKELPTATGFRIVDIRPAMPRLEMQLSVKKTATAKKSSAKNLTELKPGEEGVLEKLDLPEDDAQRLMEMGFVPGHAVTRGLSAPGGDPRVFRVDGSEVALRRETARRLILK
jgi:ferrous iron transport protein A